jgi:transposase
VSDALEASDPAFLINDVVDILNLERFEERYNRSFTTCTTRDSSI